MTNITTTSSPLPPQQTPEQRRRVADLTSGMTVEGGKLKLLPGKIVGIEERQKMEARLSTLRSCLGQRDRRAVEAIISAFLSGYGSSRGNGDEARMVVGTFASVLADTPPWAVAEAARAWSRGGYGAVASAFAPSAAQFHECAERIMANYAREERELGKLLLAEEQPVPKDERERVIDGFADLRGKLAAGNERGKPVITPEMARARFEQMCKDAGVDPDSVRDQPEHMQKLSFTHPNG